MHFSESILFVIVMLREYVFNIVLLVLLKTLLNFKKLNLESVSTFIFLVYNRVLVV